MLRFLPVVALSLVLPACTQATATPSGCDQRAALAAPPDWTGECTNAQIDWQDAQCLDGAWQLPACGTTTVLDGGAFGGQHIPLPIAITYTDDPPMSGPHRAEWPHWGEYGFVPKQRWLHSLEHGAMVVLYHPCAPTALIDALRTYAQNVPADAGGAFRWVLTPYPGLDSAFSMVTWQHRLKGNCLDTAAADAFRAAHYRKAPEDEAADGAYGCTWMGTNCEVSAGSGTDAADAKMGGLVPRDGQ